MRLTKTFSFLIAFLLAIASLNVFAQFPAFHQKENNQAKNKIVPAAAALSNQFEIKTARFGYAKFTSPPGVKQNLNFTERTKPIYNRVYRNAVFYPPEKRE